MTTTSETANQRTHPTQYRLLCYRDSFESYRKITNDIIRAIPAEPLDQVALLVCVNSDGKIGFDSSVNSQILLGTLFKGACIVHGEKLSQVASVSSRYSGRYTFKPKCDSFFNLIKEHDNFELSNKKYQIMSRHGKRIAQPTPALLTDFLKNLKRPINRELYKILQETCHYTAISVESGEHGFGAFQVISNNLDFFFEQLKSLMDETGELIFVSHNQLPYD